MKTFFIVALLACGLPANAQCKFHKDETDRFLKVRNRETRQVDLAGGLLFSYTISFVQLGDTMSIHLTAIGKEAATMLVYPDNLLVFLFENDSVITTRSRGAYRGEFFTSESGIFEAKYFADRPMIEFFSKNPLKAVRVFQTDSYRDSDVKKKWQPKIMQAAACILTP